MRFGLDVAQQRMPWDEIVRRVQLAEELGFDGAWGFDHFQPMYGEGPGETFEGMTTLAALAGATERIRLGLLVTGATYRHPSVFAAQALTVDHASHGRLELSRFLAPAVVADHRRAPVNALGYLRGMFAVDDLDGTMARLARHGAVLVGEVVEYEGVYRLCYIRGPEGLLVGLAEEVG